MNFGFFDNFLIKSLKASIIMSIGLSLAPSLHAMQTQPGFWEKFFKDLAGESDFRALSQVTQEIPVEKMVNLVPAVPASTPESKVFERSIEGFKGRIPQINNQQMALIAAAAVAAGGAYLYSKNYIQPTQKLIDESLKFARDTYNSPFNIIETAQNNNKIGTVPDILLQEKNKMVRALGLKNDYLNPASYLQKPQQESILHKLPGVSPTLGLLAYQEYDDIENFFKSFELAYNFTAETDLSSKAYDAIRKTIEYYSLKPITYLLKAKSVYQAKSERPAMSPQVFAGDSNLTDVDALIKSMAIDESYVPTDNDADSLKQRYPGILDAITIIRDYQKNPRKLYMPRKTIWEQKKEIDRLKKEKNGILYALLDLKCSRRLKIDFQVLQ